MIDRAAIFWEEGEKAQGCGESAPSWLQRNLFPDDILFPLTKVQPS